MIIDYVNMEEKRLKRERQKQGEPHREEVEMDLAEGERERGTEGTYVHLENLADEKGDALAE